MDSSTLSILIKAVDLASADIGAVKAQLATLGDTAEKTAVKTDAAAEATAKQGGTLKGLMAGAGIASLAVAAVGAVTVKMAGDFQASMVRLTTSAGESTKNLGLVSEGILGLARSTGTSTKELSDAMYVVESAGQHGADGLKVLKAAAQGAKTENAELKVVADAVSSVLQDYHLKASDSADVTSKLVAAVGQGKTTFQELAGSLHSVLPIASSAGIALSDITGALASMTVHGMSADQASQNLADTIKHMVAPTQVQTKELGQLGISSGDLAGMLGKKGITGTLQELSETILSKMGPSGKIMLDSFNKSKDAANDVNVMISKMPPSLQSLAKSFQSGKISVTDWRLALKALPVDQANLAQQFASLQNRASGFNDLLKSGQPAAQTYQDALRRVTGDATGLNVALMLTGENTEYTNNAVKNISKSTVEAGGNVKGWSEVQGTFNLKLAQFRESALTTGVAIGTALLPAATRLLDVLSSTLKPLAEFADHHQKAAAAIVLGTVAALGAIVGFLGLVKTIRGVKAALTDLQVAFKLLTATNPILLIATVAVIAAVLIITHWTQVKKFLGGLWDHIKSAGSGAIEWIGAKFDWLGKHWIEVLGFMIGFFATLPYKLPLFMAEAVVKIVEVILKVNWGAVFGTIFRLWRDGWKLEFDIVKNGFNAVVDFIMHVNWGNLAKGIGNGILDFIQGALNGAFAGLPGAPKIHIPHLASGVQGFSGGLALVGEQGPELVSLPTGSNVTPASQTAQMMSGGGQTHYHLNVNVGTYAGQPGEINQLAITLWRAMGRVARQHGKADQMPNIGILPS